MASYVLAVGDIVETKIACLGTAQQVSINVRHWRCQAITPGSATIANFMNTLNAAMQPAYKAILTLACQYYGIRAQRVYPLPKTEAEIDIGSTVNGVVVDNVLPQQLSVVGKFTTGNAGRKERGRFYVPFPYVTSQDTDDTPTAAYIANCDAIATQLATLIITTGAGTASMQPVIYHRNATGTDPKYTNITAGKCTKAYGTQRRRGEFGARNPLGPF